MDYILFSYFSLWQQRKMYKMYSVAPQIINT